MSDYKYTLIVSQYRWSRYSFIVKYEADFLDRAKNFARELITYKRSSKDMEITDRDLGDLTYRFKEGEIRQRYSVNDWGDIYFLNYEFADDAMYEAIEYALVSRRESVGYKPKIETQSIVEHHSRNKVHEIVMKYFEIT